MENRFFDRPILNSPYEYPAHYWELDASGQPTGRIVDQRRSARFISPIRSPGSSGRPRPAEMVFDRVSEELSRPANATTRRPSSTISPAHRSLASAAEGEPVARDTRNCAADPALAPPQLAEFGLNSRQIDAVAYLKTHRTLTNSQYQARFEASKRTASRDLDDLLQKGVVDKQGTTGKGVRYGFAIGAAKGPKGPRRRSPRRLGR